MSTGPRYVSQLRSLYIPKIDNNGQEDQHEELRTVPMRIPAFALAEIAFLVCLCSADGIVSLTACNCLRLLAQAERQPDALQPSEVNEDEVLKRHPIYEQLGDPKVSMIGTLFSPSV